MDMLGFNTVNGKRVHATESATVMHQARCFNTASGKRVHATGKLFKMKCDDYVSIPQAVRGYMQLYSVCILTKLAPASRAFAKCSYDVSRSPCGTSPQNGVLVKKRHFRSFLPFPNMDIVLFFVKNIGSPLAPQEVWMSTTKSVRFL